MKSENIYLKGRVRLILEDVHTGAREVGAWKDNIIVTTGKVAILRRLGNKATKTNEGMVTYGAVGTGTNSPLVSDTTLQTELARNTVATASIAGNIITLRVFFTTSEANGALKEFAWFGEDASAAADSGTMFNHIAIDKTKDSSKTLTIEQDIEYA